MKQTHYTRKNRPRFYYAEFAEMPVWTDQDCLQFFLNRPIEEITLEQIFKLMVDRRAPIYVSNLCWNIINNSNLFAFIIYFPSQEVKWKWIDVSERIGKLTFQPGRSVNSSAFAKPNLLRHAVKKVTYTNTDSQSKVE